MIKAPVVNPLNPQKEPEPAQEVVASSCAFAALLSNGTVLTWGDPDTRRIKGRGKSVRKL